YGIRNPNNQELYYPPQNKCWLYNQEKMNQLLDEGRVSFREGSGTPFLKRYLLEVRQGATLATIIDNGGFSQDSSKEVKMIFENDIFEFPKPITLLKILQITGLNRDSIILDFFSGSATTAHAVMQLNAEDGGNRKYIMVQLPEPTPENSEASKAGYKTICEIGKERIRRAGEKIKSDESLPSENREKLDTGFKVFRLSTSNIKEWDSETENLRESLFDAVDNIKSDRTSLDVLYEILLKYGLDLNVPIAENKDFYSIGGGTLLINLDSKISLSVIDSICEEYKDLLEIDEDYKATVVLRDNSFQNDVDKTNAIQRLKQAGIKEIRSI
ncbi:MAG: DNA methyltransferase, partial [Cetobacterium sp.]